MAEVTWKRERELEDYKRHVEDNLKKISSIFERIAAGDLSMEIEVPEKEDEFTRIYAGLKIMIESIQELLRARERATAAAAAAELARLREAEEARGEIEARLKELEDSRAAMIHILEDLDSSYRELRSAYRRLRVVDRMKNEFLSMTSHELKTPLTPVRSFLQLMESGRLGRITEKQREALEVISNGVDRLENSINKLLQISRLEFGKIKMKMRDLRLSDLIQSTVEKMGLMARQKGITLTHRVEELPQVRGDEEQLAEVISNLLDNAIKFTPEGGRVTVEAKRDRNRILVAVTDTGIGIAKKDIPKLFTKFFKADYSAPGVGLGLSACKKIIQAHGGRIWAVSELGKGSTFFFTLPLKR
jgi:signal transduction histidine kinase